MLTYDCSTVNGFSCQSILLDQGEWLLGWMDGYGQYLDTLLLSSILPTVSSVSLIKELADKAERGFMNRVSIDDKTFTTVEKGLLKKILDITSDEPRAWWMICCS